MLMDCLYYKCGMCALFCGAPCNYCQSCAGYTKKESEVKND